MESLIHSERILSQWLNAASGIALHLPLQEIFKNGTFIKLVDFQMELLLLGLNGSILSLLYGKLLENERVLSELRVRLSNLEGAIIERRKPIQSACHLRDDGLE